MLTFLFVVSVVYLAVVAFVTMIVIVAALNTGGKLSINLTLPMIITNVSALSYVIWYLIQ